VGVVQEHVVGAPLDRRAGRGPALAAVRLEQVRGKRLAHPKASLLLGLLARVGRGLGRCAPGSAGSGLRGAGPTRAGPCRAGCPSGRWLVAAALLLRGLLVALAPVVRDVEARALEQESGA